MLGWFDEAEEAYEKTVELEPENSVHYSILGRTYISNDKLELGRKTLQKSIEMGYGPARTNMMMLNLVDGDINAAKENIRFAADTAVSFDTLDGGQARGGSFGGGTGPVFKDDMLFVNSGYGIYFHMPGNVLLAFGLPY